MGTRPYIGDGSNRWPAVHTLDAARLYRLAVESAPAGSRLHATAEAGVPMRAIADAIGRGLGVPARSVATEQAAKVLPAGLGTFIALDNLTSSARTRAQVGWHPEQSALLADLATGHYFANAR